MCERASERERGREREGERESCIRNDVHNGGSRWRRIIRGCLLTFQKITLSGNTTTLYPPFLNGPFCPHSLLKCGESRELHASGRPPPTSYDGSVFDSVMSPMLSAWCGTM